MRERERERDGRMDGQRERLIERGRHRQIKGQTERHRKNTYKSGGGVSEPEEERG